MVGRRPSETGSWGFRRAGAVKNGEERYELWRLPLGSRKAKADW